MRSRTRAKAWTFSLAGLALVSLSLGAYFAGVAIVELDPDHRGNYDDPALATDPVARADVQEDRAEMATIAWALLTGAGALAIAAAWVGWSAPPKEHRHATTQK